MLKPSQIIFGQLETRHSGKANLLNDTDLILPIRRCFCSYFSTRLAVSFSQKDSVAKNIIHSSIHDTFVEVNSLFKHFNVSEREEENEEMERKFSKLFVKKSAFPFVSL
jgi:hypothetical protein